MLYTCYTCITERGCVWQDISLSGDVLQLLVDTSEAIDMLSSSSSSFLLVILIAIAMIPITPAIDSIAITITGTALVLDTVSMVSISSFTGKKN